MGKKTETIQEFLARGGKIKVIPPNYSDAKEANVKSTVVGPAVLMSLEDADQFYGTKTVRKKKEKQVDLTKINVDNIPDDLKKILGI
jgi:hypothetical protein